jgi:hypothetical protein
MKKKLPVGIQTLGEIIEENYLYIDKTRIAQELIETGKYYFFSRPRRFGKSLFIDTLKEIFEGNKKLFEGLHIYDNYDWSKKYPVINISFGGGTIHSRAELEEKWDEILYYNEERLDLKCFSDVYDRRCFSDLIKQAYEKYGEKVVVLVDEYDKPILDNINEVEISNEIRDGLRNLYSVIKDSDRYMKFAMLTGVTKFSKVSLFSGLNNLTDITIDDRYSDICGYTQSDIHEYFLPYLDGVDLEEVKRWYNGYSWGGTESQKVYNPFDVLLFISKGHKFENHWFQTATPTFLIELMRDKNYFLPKVSDLEIDEELIGSFDVNSIKIETLLFQSGYLTIQDIIQSPFGMTYKLGYPNLEVQNSLNNSLIKVLQNNSVELRPTQMKLYNAIMSDDFTLLEKTFRSLYASIPYNNFTNNDIYNYEGYYASVFYAYLASLGLDIRAEDVTNRGRIDLTIILPTNSVYVIEFKTEEGANALEQIKENRYYEKYESDSKKLFLVGIHFSKAEKNIESFEVEQS